MAVSMTKERFDKMTAQLDHWRSKRTSFTLKQGAQLLRLLEHASTYIVCAKFLFHALKHSMLVVIRKKTKKYMVTCNIGMWC